MLNISSDVIRGYNDTIILYLLLDRPSYGYEISKQIRLISEEKYVIKETTLYSAFTRLEKNGYIRRDPTKPRAIEIVDDDFNLVRREIVNVPLIGNVAAGEPIFAEQNIEGYFPLLADDMPSGEAFMLKVKGESMINVGIYDGDHIIVHKQNTARNGDLVVALVDDSATVKTFYKEKGHFRLQPENDTMEPIIVNEVEILGTVAGLYRRY